MLRIIAIHHLKTHFTSSKHPTSTYFNYYYIYIYIPFTYGLYIIYTYLYSPHVATKDCPLQHPGEWSPTVWTLRFLLPCGQMALTQFRRFTQRHGFFQWVVHESSVSQQGERIFNKHDSSTPMCWCNIGSSLHLPPMCMLHGSLIFQ